MILSCPSLLTSFVRSSACLNASAQEASFSTRPAIASPVATVPLINVRLMNTGTRAGAVAKRINASKTMKCAPMSARSDVNATMGWFVMS